MQQRQLDRLMRRLGAGDDERADGWGGVAGHARPGMAAEGGSAEESQAADERNPGSRLPPISARRGGAARGSAARGGAAHGGAAVQPPPTSLPRIGARKLDPAKASSAPTTQRVPHARRGVAASSPRILREEARHASEAKVCSGM